METIDVNLDGNVYKCDIGSTGEVVMVNGILWTNLNTKFIRELELKIKEDGQR